MAETKLRDYDYSDGFIRWVEALKEKRTVTVLSLERMREKFPEEYEYYKDMDLKSLIAVPYNCGVSGFFIVKNPGSNTECADILQMISHLIAHELNDIRMVQRLEYQIRPMDVESERDIVIRLFGGLEISSSAGVIPPGEIHNKVIGRIIAVLTTRRHYSASARELARILNPDRDPGESAKNISKVISKFRLQYASFFGNEQLIVMAGTEYQLNPYYNIKIDYKQFDTLRKSAKNAMNEAQKISFLQMALDLYHGHISSDFEDDHWMVALTQEYKRRLHSTVDDLCGALFKRRDYDAVHHYAARGLEISPASEKMYLWVYHALIQKKCHSQACDVLLAAQDHLPPDSYHDLFKSIGSAVRPKPAFT